MAGINRSFDKEIIDLIESAARNVKAQPVNLGGVSGSLGGSGGPPGGYIGQLPQTRVAYDSSEMETLFTPASGMSLLDNLNHIRYRIGVLEGGSGVITVEQWGGTPSISPVTTIVFSGATVVDNGGGEVEVQINAGSGSGAATFLELTDTPASYVGYSGYHVSVKGDETGLELIPAPSGGSSVLVVEEYDGSPSVTNVDRIIFSGATVSDLGDGDVLVQVTASGGGGATSLDDLSDVVITTPAQGHMLIRSTSNWINKSISYPRLIGRLTPGDINEVTVSEARNFVFQNQVLQDGVNYISFFASPGINSPLIIDNAEDRIEIGADHYIPTRNASNPNVYFNEANQDMDFYIEGTTDADLVFVDAGNNRVGIGKTPSYKLDVDGDVNVSSGSVYRVNGTALSSIFADISNGVTNGNSHNHVGGDGADLTYLDAILAYASGVSQVPAGTTYYFFPHITSMQAGIGAIIYPVAGTMKNMAVRLSSAQPGTGSLVITLMKNLSATDLVITIAAGTAGGTTHSNTVNTVSWNAFDLLTWRIVNNASSTSGSVTSFTMQQERNTA